MDYILAPHRWKHSVLNVESDTSANLVSDHYPVIAKIRIKLRADRKGKGPGRQKYQESTKEQKMERNKNMIDKFETLTQKTEDLQAKTISVKSILEEGTKELPTIPKKEKGEALSIQTRQLLQQRKNAMLKNNVKAYDILDKRFRKSKREDKTNMIIKTLDKDLDTRDTWLGIRQLKQDYQPNPYARKNKDGTHITQKERAQKAAEYFSKEQWGTKRKRDNEEEEATQTSKRTIKIQTAKGTETQYETVCPPARVFW